ncbi:MAG: hypothetical protein ACOZF0_03305 [Thermodesulfobacteriota bacterium]
MMRTIQGVMLLVVISCLTFGCAAYSSKKALKQIRPGMTRSDLTERLDKPVWSGKKADGYYYMKYYLTDDAAVGTAFYFVFGPEMRLLHWYEDKTDEVVDTGDVIGHLMTP